MIDGDVLRGIWLKRKRKEWHWSRAALSKLLLPYRADRHRIQRWEGGAAIPLDALPHLAELFRMTEREVFNEFYDLAKEDNVDVFDTSAPGSRSRQTPPRQSDREGQTDVRAQRARQAGV